MIKELKSKIVEELENFMLKHLFNHRKKKEGLISVQNQLIDDVLRFLDDWKKTEVSYLDLRIRYNGFENLTQASPSARSDNNDFKAHKSSPKPSPCPQMS